MKKMIEESERSIEDLEDRMKDCKAPSLDFIHILQSLTLVTCTGLHRPQQCQSRMQEGFMEPSLLPLNYWMMRDSGRGEIIVFSCIPTDEPPRL